MAGDKASLGVSPFLANSGSTGDVRFDTGPRAAAALPRPAYARPHRFRTGGRHRLRRHISQQRRQAATSAEIELPDVEPPPSWRCWGRHGHNRDFGRGPCFTPSLSFFLRRRCSGGRNRHSSARTGCLPVVGVNTSVWGPGPCVFPFQWRGF